MKKFSFDNFGHLSVTETVLQLNADGVQVENSISQTIQKEQIAKHLPMYLADMTPGEIATANGIINSLGAA